MSQVSIWDVLGTPAVEMRKPKPAWIPPVVPAAPEPPFPAFTAEDLAAIEHFAKGSVQGSPDAHASIWNAFILKGAVPSSILVPPGWGWAASRVVATVRITRTRLGYTGGFQLDMRDGGSFDPGFQHPNWDAVGAFMWANRQAAIHHGAHGLWDASPEWIKSHVREHFAARGIDVTEPPDEVLKRRLVSRAELRAIDEAGPSAEDLALIDLGPTEDVIAYERAIGLTDVDGIPAQ